MTQASSRRIVTEVALEVSQLAQNNDIANHETRIGAVEVLGGLAPGDISDATATSLIANDASSTSEALKARLVSKGELAKNVRDYKAPTDTDDAAAISLAHGANPAVFYPDGNYSPGADSNLYNSVTVRNAIGPRWQSGVTGTPVADARPVVWVQKHTSAAYSGGWDEGAIYGALIKESGDAYGAGITGYVATFGGSGDMTGVHGRARTAVDGSNGFGVWAYAHNTAAAPGRVVAVEADIRNDSATQPTWAATAQTGAISNIVVALSDGISGAHHGIRFPQRAADNFQRFWTGLQFDTNTIMPTDASGNGEAIRIRGASYASGRYGGVTLGDSVGTHMLTYGLRTLHADISNQAAVWMARDHRIIWGPDQGSGAGRWVTITSDAAPTFDVHGATVSVNGVQVLKGRRTGWGNASGTVDRSAWSTYSAPTIGASYTQAQIQALADAVQANSRRLAALQQDLTDHGVIGA